MPISFQSSSINATHTIKLYTLY